MTEPRTQWATTTGDRPDTICLVAEDGTTHRYRFNPETRAYTIDLGAIRIPTEAPHAE